MALAPYVLNVGVLTPAYLARDVADVQRLTDGRLELGLGTGYEPAEFEAAGVPYGTGGDRLRALQDKLKATRELLAADADLKMPPIMLSGAGERMLQFAGREADIFSFSIMAGMTPGVAPEEALAERVEVLRESAAGRIDEIELNLFVAGVGNTVQEADLSIIRQASGLADEQIAQLPGVLVGSAGEIAEGLLRYRDEFGISYISVLEPHMSAFAEVIALLR